MGGEGEAGGGLTVATFFPLFTKSEHLNMRNYYAPLVRLAASLIYNVKTLLSRPGLRLYSPCFVESQKWLPASRGGGTLSMTSHVSVAKKVPLGSETKAVE